MISQSIEQSTIPHDLEAEQAILGTIMLDNSAIKVVLSIIKSPTYFYTSAHQHIFRAIIELSGKNDPIDSITVGDELKSLFQLDDVGGYAYLGSLEDHGITYDHIPKWCKIVAEHAFLRQIVSVTSDASRKARDPESTAKDLIDETMDKLSELRGRLSVNAKAVSVHAALPEIIDKIEQVNAGKMEIGIMSGYDKFDRFLGGGAQKGDLIFIGAEPSIGKTSLAVCLSYSFVLKARKGLIFSLESSRESIIRDRLLPAALSINSHALRAGKFDQNKWEDLHELAKQDFLKNLLICDESTMNINDIYSLIAMEKDIDFAMIDFTQLIAPVTNTGNRNNDLGVTARGLKKINKDFNIPIVALSQMTNEKLRDSGELEHVADVKIILTREDDDIINCGFKKNRNGIVGNCPMQFIPEYTKFKSVE
jgi:replicative DNA helicase